MNDRNIPAKTESLVHRVCAYIREREQGMPPCVSCPETVQTPYGAGTQMCRVIAQELIDLVRSAPETNDKQWRCFHCDEVFADQSAAAEHFGKSEMLQPACTIDVAEYRRMEEVNRRHCGEDTDLHREIYRMSADHAVALRREEEKGYARGLRDAQHVETTAECSVCAAGMNFFIDPNTGRKMHARNGTVVLCSAQKISAEDNSPDCGPAREVMPS